MWVTPSAGQPYESDFVAATQRYGLPQGLLSRVAYQESRYKPDAFNKASGASGMMQIVPKWHPGVDPFNPKEAIPYAAKYLRELYDRFGDWSLAVAGYNAGPGNVEKYGGVPPFQETIAYVQGVMRDVGDAVLQHAAQHADKAFSLFIAAVVAVALWGKKDA